MPVLFGNGAAVTHTVTVTEDGFEYGGTSYPSLTKIAKKITGAHWSGTMTVKKCPECGTRRSLRSTVALWAGRIVLICIAGVISTLSGLSLVMRFFGGH